MALSFAAFAALLIAFYKVATDLRTIELARNCISVGTIVVVASVAAVACRLWMGSAARLDFEDVLVAGAIALVASLTAVIAYLTLVNRMQHRLADEVMRLDRARENGDSDSD